MLLALAPRLCCGMRGRGRCPRLQMRTPRPRALQGHPEGARLLQGQLGWGPGGSFQLWPRLPPRTSPVEGAHLSGISLGDNQGGPAGGCFGGWPSLWG